MDWTLKIESAVSVRAAIARVMLGSESSEAPLGSIRLKPHQSSSVEPIMRALDEFGGAFLCDQVGMGKTFVALAVARRFPRAMIVAPAALESMWRDAMLRACVDGSFSTYERLSRSEYRDVPADLLILDEAHHARNPRTRRYRRISRLARRARVIMLSATPIHNRRADLLALLSLFLGSRANTLTEAELARCVFRKDREAARVSGIPQVEPMISLDLPDDPTVVSRLMDLPPSLPVRDGGSGGSLVNRGLVHQWASSEAALRDALRRRIARAAALVSSLEAGRYPSASELQTWTFSEGALQLGFPEFLAPSTHNSDALLDSVTVHATALETFLKSCTDASIIDDARSHHLLKIRREGCGAKIVAFAQYSSTVAALFRRIGPEGRVAMLTAGGARVAGGKLSRQEAIERFAPRANRCRSPSRADAIDVLVCTDLLSEGVNLQDAEIVVHLDVPWTAARMEQRVGRVARMGSLHPHVRTYQLRPPASAEAVLQIETLVGRKWRVAGTSVGVNPGGPDPDHGVSGKTPSSIPARAEKLRTIMERWRTGDPGDADERIHAAAVSAGESGFVAACRSRGCPLLLVCRTGGLSVRLDAQIDACFLAEGPVSSAGEAEFRAAFLEIDEWAQRMDGMQSAGADVSFPTRRRSLFNRIDGVLRSSPPHLRAQRARAAADARRVASVAHGATIEEELAALTKSALGPDEWLSAIAALGSLPGPEPRLGPANFRVLALLLFKH